MRDIKTKIAVAALCAIAGCSDAPAPPASEAAPAAAADKRDTRANILFLGTSLTAGYGVGAGNAFPALIQQKLDSAGLPYRVVNAGLSGETSAGGLRRLDWSLQQPIAVLVLELGANDGLRGLATDQLAANLDSIITRTRERYPDAEVLIAGMEAPPNLGATYTQSFRGTFRDIAAKHDAVLLPFLLEGVAGDVSLNQEDGIHPTAAGHRRIAETLWLKLQPLLQQQVSARKAPAATG